MQLGYIGLGNMRGAPARRLMREHQLRVFDLRPRCWAASPRGPSSAPTGATPMVLANIVRKLFQTVINEHGADKDTQTLVRLFERNAGVAIAP